MLASLNDGCSLCCLFRTLTAAASTRNKDVEQDAVKDLILFFVLFCIFVIMSNWLGFYTPNNWPIVPTVK